MTPNLVVKFLTDMQESTIINNLVVDVYHLNKALEKGDLDLDYLAKATNTLVHTNQVHDFSLDFVDKQTLANVCKLP